MDTWINSAPQFYVMQLGQGSFYDSQVQSTRNPAPIPRGNVSLPRQVFKLQDSSGLTEYLHTVADTTDEPSRIILLQYREWYTFSGSIVRLLVQFCSTGPQLLTALIRLGSVWLV